ncbi:MAG TPA: hypothetical protein H9752_07850, partial [Candidatus Phocaeicola excrementigallinarum]|nr:hypothetical protein [Candidatus Phocaeicola excrementigallinarum]
TILDILMWALPSGFLSGLVTWLASRRTFNARNKKEREDTYKTLYDDLSTTTLDLSRQIRKLNEKIINHETAIHKCYTCRYADRCPAVIFLRQQKVQQPNSRPLGQPQCERNRANHLRAGPEADGGPEGECGGDDAASGPS